MPPIWWDLSAEATVKLSARVEWIFCKFKVVLCCRSDKDLVNQERSLAMYRDDSKSAGSRNREVGLTHTHVNTHHMVNVWFLNSGLLVCRLILLHLIIGKLTKNVFVPLELWYNSNIQKTQLKNSSVCSNHTIRFPWISCRI